MGVDLKESYDVVVVGAGPGGCYAAIQLARAGLEVLLLDRAQEIGVPKETGEGLSKGAVERLKLKLPSYCIAQEIRKARVYAPNGNYVDVRGEGYIVEMKRFVKWLACEAASAGAKVLAKSSVYDVLKEGGKVCGVRFIHLGKDFEVRASAVVAADGVESRVAKMAGLDTTLNPALVDSGIQYELAGIELEDPHRLEIFLGNKIAPRGYVWIFPKGANVANVGVGIGGNHSQATAKYYLDEFIARYDGLRKGSIVEVNAGCIPVGGFLKNMVLDGLVVIGDAAHQVNPLHGGGIAEAMTAGKIAAEVLAKAKKLDDFSKEVLAEYNKRWWKERGNKLRMVEKARELVEKLSDEQLNKLAEVLKGEDIEEIVHGNIVKLARVLVKFGLAKLK